jgi:hypothetical protein
MKVSEYWILSLVYELVINTYHWRSQGERSCRAADLPKRNLKNTDFVDTILSKVLRDLLLSLNQPLKSADKYCIGILNNASKTYNYVDCFVFQLVLMYPVA